MKLIDLTGKMFGNLLVLGRSLDAKYEKFSQVGWVCECQCGSKIIKSVWGSSLRVGQSKGCGCNSKLRLRPYEALYNMMKRTNTGGLRTLDFQVTYEEFLEFTKIKNCHYCYVPIVWKKHTVSGHGYNLDRKDNDRGYLKDNITVCCKRCNLGKRDTFSYEEWYGMTKYFRDSYLEKG